MGIFNAAEVIDMGIEKEKKRRDFYGMVAENFKEKDMKELFGRLKNWEESHIKKFTEIRESVKESEATDSFPGELNKYMNVLVDDKLYNVVDPFDFAKNVKDPLTAIQYGIGFEKDAILFFNELLGAMDPMHQDAVRSMIEEEKQHIVFLVQLRDKYRK